MLPPFYKTVGEMAERVAFDARSFERMRDNVAPKCILTQSGNERMKENTRGALKRAPLKRLGDTRTPNPNSNVHLLERLRPSQRTAKHPRTRYCTGPNFVRGHTENVTFPMT